MGGAQGLRDITDAHIGGVTFQSPQPFYYLALAVCVLAIYVSWRLQDSRIGLSPLTTSFTDVREGLAMLRDLLA